MKIIKVFIFLLSLVAVKSPWAEITIMPLGDSITAGEETSSLPPEKMYGYRKELFNHLTTSGYDIDFVGSLESGSFIENQHEGHSGWRDDQIADDVYGFLNDHPADIILLHIGTNELNTNPSDVEDILNEIDRWETDNGKTVLVILAKIINREGHVCPAPSTTTTFNSNVEAMALSRSDDRLVLVDMECSAGLNYLSDMADFVHPNPTGYAKMADQWFTDGLLYILPMADAGGDQNVNEKTLVTLNGSGSDDPDGSLLGYWWEQQSGTSVDLFYPTDPNPTFTAPEVGSGGERLIFKLTVTDADGFQHSDTVFIDIGNAFMTPPMADAGADQNVKEEDTVTLNGSQSYDPDGTIASVQWEQVSGKNQVTLTDPTELTTGFTAPSVDSEGDVLTFKLTIKDNDDLVSSDTVAITVNIREAPVTDAGPDQNVTEGSTVTLNGINSYDPDGTIAAVQWEQVSGKNQVTLTDPTELTTGFTAPSVDTEGDVLTFKLTIKDNDDLVSSDTVTITVRILGAPIADAGPDQNVTEGNIVTLNGINSYDPDGSITSVHWQQIAGNIQVALTTPNELTTKFTAPAVNSDGDTLTFRLMIKDNDDLVSEDNVDVMITPPVVSAADSGRGGSGGGGCFIEVIMH